LIDTGAYTGGVSNIGNDGETAHFAIAYDARNNTQNKIWIQYDTADSSSFTSPVSHKAIALTESGAGVECFTDTFTIPAIGGNPPRWYRLVLDGGTDRTASAVPKIFYFDMFDKDDVLIMGTSPHAGQTTGAGLVTPISRAAVARTAVGALATNKYAEYGTRFDTTFQPADVTLWKAIRDHLAAQGGPNLANFVMHEGIKNGDLDDFFLCRVMGNDFYSSREYIDEYEASLTWETEPWL